MQRIYAAVFAALGWFALIGQYVVAYADTPAGIWNYISFFTIQSNVLVALTLTSAALAPQSGFARLMSRPGVATATAVYITVTGLVYYFILSKLWILEGWPKHFDHIFHYVIPTAFVLYWLLWIRKGTLHLHIVPAILGPPLLYGVYTIARGAVVTWYPYPFVDVTKLGYPHVFINIGGFVVFFALVATIYVLIDHVVGRLKRAA